MSLVSYKELVKLVEKDVINAPLAHISGSSIDITLDDIILIEKNDIHKSSTIVDLKAKDSLAMQEFTLTPQGFMLRPGQFILASSCEVFNLPNNIAAEYKLKSSLARSGLQHLLAGWCDPGWTGSKLTLELKNVSQFHRLLLKPGMKIGQVIFWECDPVPDSESYAVKGQYNGQEKVTGNKGVR